MIALRVALLLMFCTTLLVAQDIYLVSPNNEVIPLRKGEQASSVIAKRSRRQAAPDAVTCTNQATFGYPPSDIPDSFVGRHKDVLAQWFVAKAAGTIDTIFWRTTSNGALDSVVYLRVMESRIGRTSDPAPVRDHIIPHASSGGTGQAPAISTGALLLLLIWQLIQRGSLRTTDQHLPYPRLGHH